jgi:hypothetical protein
MRGGVFGWFCFKYHAVTDGEVRSLSLQPAITHLA